MIINTDNLVWLKEQPDNSIDHIITDPPYLISFMGKDWDKANSPAGNAGGMNNHPTVKPIALMEWLIKLVSKERQTILDPFMGSGSTGIACVLLGREFIGLELNSDYCEIAEKRIKHFTEEIK